MATIAGRTYPIRTLENLPSSSETLESPITTPGKRSAPSIMNSIKYSISRLNKSALNAKIRHKLPTATTPYKNPAFTAPRNALTLYFSSVIPLFLYMR